MSIELIFWLTVLGVWLTVVIKGLAWFERCIDNYLDRWFARQETNDEGDI
jgi:hypothetical protein